MLNERIKRTGEIYSMNKIILIGIIALFMFVIPSVSASINSTWVSPAQPMVNGNNYVFVTFGNSSYVNKSIEINITDSNSVIQRSCNINLNEYGYGRCKYNMTSADVSGLWNFTTNITNVHDHFNVSKMSMTVTDKNRLTSIKYGQKTTLEINFSYEQSYPNEIDRRILNSDLGTFASPSTYADINGQGDQDLLIIDTSTAARLYIWNNISRLTRGIRLVAGTDWRSNDMGTFTATNDCIWQDFNANGINTLICVENTLSRMIAFRDVNLANGITQAANFTTPTIAGALGISGLTGCDVTGDGIYDHFAFTNNLGNVTIHNYTDTAGFSMIYQTPDWGTGIIGNKNLCGDFDGDSYNEWLLNVYETGYYFADVNPTNPSQITLGDQADDQGSYSGQGAVVDFDNDGKMEAIVPEISGRFQILQFNKSGTNLLETDITWGKDNDYGTYGSSGQKIKIDDVNKNGRPDFVTTASVNYPDLIFTEYNGSWWQESLGKIRDQSSHPTAYVDFDGDGIEEIMAFGMYSGNTYIYKFNGDNWDLIYKGWQGSELDYTGDAVTFAGTSILGWQHSDCAVGDIDDDGKEEALCAFNAGNFVIYEEGDAPAEQVTPELTITATMNDGTSESFEDKYTDARLLASGKTICTKQNIARGVTDAVNQLGTNIDSIGTRWTDGILSTGSIYTVGQVATDYSTITASTTREASWTRLKLPQNYTVGKIRFWNYFNDGRGFYNVIVRSTPDPNGTLCNWRQNDTIFDNSATGTNERYGESYEGKVVYFDPVQIGCLRESTAGSDYSTTTLNTGNLRTEIEIYETDLNCSLDFSLDDDTYNLLGVKDDWVINISVTDTTGHLVNMSSYFSLPVTYDNLPFYMTIVGGTEYYPGQEGQIVLQLKDEFNDPKTGASCNLTYYYPNMSIWIADQSASELANYGVYYNRFNVTNVDGVYTAVANCTVGSFSDIDSHTFHVSGILNEINRTATAINSTVTNSNLKLTTINNTVAYLNGTIFMMNNTLFYVNQTTGTIYAITRDTNSTVFVINQTTMDSSSKIALINNSMFSLNNTLYYLNMTSDNTYELSKQINNTVTIINQTTIIIQNTITYINNTVVYINQTVDDTKTIAQEINNTVSLMNFFDITALIAGSPRYPNETMWVEATFSGQNGTAITPDSINLTIFYPDFSVWKTAIDANFSVSDNIWKFNTSINSSPTTGMYTVHLRADYGGITNSKTAQFRIASGGPYKVALLCPSESNIGEDISCTVVLQDEGEAGTESTTTVWVDLNNNGVINAGEPQASFSKKTVPLQNVSQALAINIPSSVSPGLYLVRADTEYLNSDQPNSGASDSVTLKSESVSAGAGGASPRGGGGDVAAAKLANMTFNMTQEIKGAKVSPASFPFFIVLSLVGLIGYMLYSSNKKNKEDDEEEESEDEEEADEEEAEEEELREEIEEEERKKLEKRLTKK
jgi:hypothetical protein